MNTIRGISILSCLGAALLGLAACSKQEAPPPAEAPKPKARSMEEINAEARRLLNPIETKAPELRTLLLINSNETEVLEQRFVAEEKPEVRFGPGKEYDRVSATLLKGSLVHVMEEAQGWIRIKLNPADPSSVGWMNKFASFNHQIVDASVFEKDIATLKGIGILVSISPDNNTAMVSTNIWNDEELAVQNGISRTLAYYCGQKKGGANPWVDIRDSASGQKVAKYTTSMGFRSYLAK